MQLLRSVTAVVMATNSAAVETFEHAESIFAKCKRQRLENYVEGRARAAYHFQESLKQSFSSPTRIGGRDCKRHCTQGLAGLKAAFLQSANTQPRFFKTGWLVTPLPRSRSWHIKTSQVLIRYCYRLKINNNLVIFFTQLKTSGSTRMCSIPMETSCSVRTALLLVWVCTLNVSTSSGSSREAEAAANSRDDQT